MADKMMNILLGERWMVRKKNMAIANANEMVDQINKEQKDKMILGY
jgi:hypothetical protein